jgi:CheY-like chemotaxis protein
MTLVPTILVVDDDSAVRALTAALLEHFGFRAVQASCGDEALVLAGGQRIDLLLSDFHMPGMNGAELAESVRSQRPETPVLLMSAAAPDDLVDTTRLPLLPKPFSAAALLAAVREALDCRNLMARAASALQRS